MAEDTSRTAEEQRARRNPTQALQQPEHGQDAQAAQRGSSSYSPALVRDQRLSQHGNASIRSGVMHAMGNTHGNRSVQRFMQGLAATAGPNEDQLARRIESASGSGSKLDASVKGTLEESLGVDMSGVKVHTGSDADTLARSMSAVAFTTGQDIFFREGSFDPHSTEGLKLLAHEATHTVQQAAGPVDGTPTPGGVSISNPSDSFEQEAEQAAERVTEGTAAGADVAQVQNSQSASPSAMSVQRFSMPSLGGILGGLGGMLGGAGIGQPYMPPSFGGGGGGIGGLLGGLGGMLGGGGGGGLLGGLGGMLGDGGIGQPYMPGMGGDLGGGGGGMIDSLGDNLRDAGIGQPYMPGMGDSGMFGGGGGGLLDGLGGNLADAGIGQPYMAPGMGDSGMFDGGGGGGLLDGLGGMLGDAGIGQPYMAPTGDPFGGSMGGDSGGVNYAIPDSGGANNDWSSSYGDGSSQGQYYDDTEGY